MQTAELRGDGVWRYAEPNKTPYAQKDNIFLKYSLLLLLLCNKSLFDKFQGILYIGLKNPYFENNALLETTRVTLETGTIYKYNALPVSIRLLK